MSKIRITVSASWEEEVDHQKLVEICDEELEIEGDPSEDDLAEAFDIYKEDREEQISGNPVDEIRGKLTIDIEDVR